MAIIYPQTKCLKELLRDKYYKIPLYQRPYDWEIDHVSELWDDVIKNESGYFLGIVLFKPEPAGDPHPMKFEVVDGQQRLTTLLLLLRAAIKTLENVNAKEDARDFQRDYIVQKSAGERESRLTLVLSKRDKDKFESILRGEEFSVRRMLSSWKNLDKAFQFFCEKFEELIKNQGKEGVVSFLNEKILKLSFLEVALGTDSDVYQFFETLNDRGMDLSIADLVKNRVCAETVRQGRDVEDSAREIDDISEQLGSGKLKSFLLHYCWANDKGAEPTPRKKLMDWYVEWINQTKDIRKFLSDIEEHASQYANFIEPERCSDLGKRMAFTFFDALGATRCYPLLLVGERLLSKKDFLKLCRAIEILTFRHSTVLKRDAKVLEGVFYEMIKDIRKKKPIDEVLKVLEKQEAIKSDEQFKLAFAELSAANHKTARYILLKIEEAITGKKQAPLDWKGLTLEHILAEKLDWDGREEYLERLGNLTLLSQPMNGNASNVPFKEKRKKVYEKEKRIQITKNLISFTDFTKDQIIYRQKSLADSAVKTWSYKSI